MRMFYFFNRFSKYMLTFSAHISYRIELTKQKKNHAIKLA